MSITEKASGLVERSGDAGGRVVAPGPDVALRASGAAPAAARARSSASVAEHVAVVVVERRLERGRAHVPVEDARVGVVEDRRLDPPAEQRLRLAHEVLVERVLARDQHGEPVPAAAGAAPLLAQAGDRAGEAGRDHAVEQADVDPELERVGGRDAEQLARGEPPLDLAPLTRRVPGAVGGEPVAVLAAEPVDGEAVDQLRRLAALGEAERPQPARDELGHQPRRLAERARADAELLVEERRVPERDRPLGARRCVVPDHGHVEAEQRPRELARVRDRRRGEQELRVGAVDPRDPAQAAEDVPDVRAEDAAVDVRLVDDDVGEVRRARRPSGRGAGRTPTWSMSGFESTRFDHLRICQRRSASVSPS